jgi:hypothetical protein
MTPLLPRAKSCGSPSIGVGARQQHMKAAVILTRLPILPNVSGRLRLVFDYLHTAAITCASAF